MPQRFRVIVQFGCATGVDDPCELTTEAIDMSPGAVWMLPGAVSAHEDWAGIDRMALFKMLTIGTMALCPTWTPGRSATGRTSRSVDAIPIDRVNLGVPRSRRQRLPDGKVRWVEAPYAAVQPSSKGPGDEENDPVMHDRSRERVTTHRCQWMLDRADHIRSRRWRGVGPTLTVVRAEQLRRAEPIDATIDTDVANGEHVPQQLPHPGADQIDHPHANRDVHAHYAGPHRYGDAWNGQAGREQYRGSGRYAVDGRERQSDVFVEWSDDQR